MLTFQQDNLLSKRVPQSECYLQAALALVVNEREELAKVHGTNGAANLAYGFRANQSLKRSISFNAGTTDEPKEVQIHCEFLPDNKFRLQREGDEKSFELMVNSSKMDTFGEIVLQCVADNRTFTYSAVVLDGAVHLFRPVSFHQSILKLINSLFSF